MPEQHKARIFVGRSTEQAVFNEVLERLISGEQPQPPPPTDWLTADDDDLPANPDLPHVFLISGHGGIGKSRLLERFHRVVEKAQAAGVCRTLEIIRFEEGNRFTASRRESVDALEVLGCLAGKLKALGELAAYAAAEIVVSALAGDITGNRGPVAVGQHTHQTNIAHADSVNGDQPDKEEGERERRERLDKLRTALAQDLRRLSEDRPLVLCLDTYVLVDQADQELRPLYLQSGPRVVWVIAGRDSLVADRPSGDGPFAGTPVSGWAGSNTTGSALAVHRGTTGRTHNDLWA